MYQNAKSEKEKLIEIYSISEKLKRNKIVLNIFKQYIQIVGANEFVFIKKENKENEENEIDKLVLEQDKLCKIIFNNSTLDSIPVFYKRSILKKLINLLESNHKDVDFEIYNLYISILNSKQSDDEKSLNKQLNKMTSLNYIKPSVIYYCLQDPYLPIAIKENRNVISFSGTTGFRTWEAAFALGEYLIKNYKILFDIKDGNILELGTGTGFISLICFRILEYFKIKNKFIYSTDGDDSILKLCMENIQLNDASEYLKPAKLIWGGNEKFYALSNLILASDVTYDSRFVPDLVQTLKNNLHENSYAIIAAAKRKQETITYFLNLCESNSLKVTQEIFKTTGIFYYGSSPEMYIFTVKLDSK